ncbi:unnamed protein product, partial [Meganyctiphanes norvegica]
DFSNMLANLTSRQNRGLLLLVIGLFSYIIYTKSTEADRLQQDLMLQTLAEVRDQGAAAAAAAAAAAVADPAAAVDAPAAAVATPANKFYTDEDGNEIPLFDDNTLYPKPGGGFCDMAPIADKEEYFQVMENTEVECKDMQKFNLYQLCLDGFKNRDNCVVLSFGISFMFGYEDSLIDRLGCVAYSFDPTMNTEDYVRKDGKDKFYNLGISSFKGVKTMNYEKRRDLTCKVDRYVNIVKMLGLIDRQIDFLKIDVEGSELDFFLDTASNHPELLENVWQFQLEFHNMEECCYWHSGNSKTTTQFDMMKIVRILHCHGFKLAHTRWNPNPKLHFQYNGKERSVAYVTTWIRV